MSKVPIINVIQRVVEKMGAKLVIEPEWGCVGQIAYQSGVKRYFRLSSFDLNTMGASEIARDKGHTKFFLNEMGYSVPEGKTFLSPGWSKSLGINDQTILERAWAYVEKLGTPVFVKPNSESCGVGVSKVYSKSEFFQSVTEAFLYDRVILVEKAVSGKDYRIVVCDGEVIAAYERIPLFITGDGKSTIKELIEQERNRFQIGLKEMVINEEDFRLTANLLRNNLTLQSVLGSGQSISLLDNANLSSGGKSIDVTSKIHPEFRNVVAKISADLGLRLAGVDLIVKGDLSNSPVDTPYWILEVNSAPGLDYYATMGERQKAIVDKLYLHVVTEMERAHERVVDRF